MAKVPMTEEHILSHLPRNQFHSCLLTTFSFDFNFFYHEVRSQLNRADIINTNVLVDDAMLQHYLGTMTGYVHDSAKKFAITGIPSREGVFHPKLGLFFGEEKGFLVLGSGNLTACGHGKNQELWGAFHINGPEDPKAPLFKKAWNYLRGFKDQMSGISRHKIEWIEQHAGWVHMVPDAEDDQWISLDAEIEAQFLTNSEESIWDKLSGLLETEHIEDVTVISPFFDGQGDTLANLCNLAGNAEVHLIAQVQSCAFPKKESFQLPRNLVFHDWNSLQGEGENRYLHAKLVYVKTSSCNYCLIGSANLTSAGMGADDKKAKNEEASILVRTKNDILEEKLGLGNRGIIVAASEIIASGNPIEGRFSKTAGPLRVSSIDRYATLLHVYMEPIPETRDVELRLFNGWEEQVASIPIGVAEYSSRYSRYNIEIAVADEVFFGQLYNVDTEVAVSNKVMVHDAKALLNTNPDPANKKLEKAITQIENGQSDLLSLLQYIDPEDIVDTKRKSGGGGGKNALAEQKQDGTGEVLDYDNFTQQGDISAQTSIELHSRVAHTIDRILELVRLLLQKAAEQASDNLDVDEEAEKENVEGTEGREDEKVKIYEPVLPPQKQSVFATNQRKLKRFLEKYIKIQAALLEKKTPPTKLDHSLFAVVMHLLIDFYKKPIMVEERAGELQKKYLLDSHNDFFDKMDFCRYVTEIIGQHSLLLSFCKNDGLNAYERGIIDNVKRRGYWNAVCAISLAATSRALDKKKETWIWELYMNLRHQCGVNDCGVRAKASEHLSSLINIIEIDDRERLFAEMMGFWERHERMFQDFKKSTGCKGGLKEVGLRVFSDAFGFCHISSCEVSGQESKIELSRPGYPPNVELQDFPRKYKCIAERTNLKLTRPQ